MSGLSSPDRSIATRALVRALLLFAALAAGNGPRAGELDRVALTALFPPPYEIGQREAQPPVWPLFARNGPYLEQVGYLFESLDLAPLPGFAGIPVNLLVAMDMDGRFVEARLVSQHEPVFLDGLGPAPLHEFIAQYAGLSVHQNIKVSTSIDRRRRADSTNVYVDGVSKATASVRIINESVLAAALEVARAKLGVGAGAARPRGELLDPEPRTLAWEPLLRSGLVQRWVVSNAEAEAAFADSPAAGLDPLALANPHAPLVEVYLAWFNLPTVQRSLFAARDGDRIRRDLGEDLALLVLSRGRYGVVAEDFVPHSVPDRLGLVQYGFPVGMRDMDRDERLAGDGLPGFRQALLFRIGAETGLDPAGPVRVNLRVSRFKGSLLPERISRDFGFEFQVPAAYRTAAVAAPVEAPWVAAWRERAIDLAVLVIALGLLGVVLARPATLAADARRLARFRWAWLLFCLVFIGWYAQAQLSVVNLTAALQALQRGGGLGFMLHDPMTLVLWSFVALSLVLWGRGTFCGWLCPFGALQELLAGAARRLGLRRLTVPAAIDRPLLRGKYLVLAALLVSAGWAPTLADRLVEIEPFKTSITLVFVRTWPYVAYAGVVLLISALVYKAFCRYLCPLGAALALAGRLRALDWIPRRAACGSRCQLCRRACQYDAIDRAGRIDYAECFQCLDCVGIYHDRRRCAPLLLHDRKGGPREAVAPTAVVSFDPVGASRRPD